MTGKYLAVLLLMTAVLGLGLAQDAEEPDPLPLRRVVIPLERVAAEVERARPGVVLQIPRDEFESKVRRAREAAAAAKFKPRLLTARYAAQLSGTTLVGGSGHWQVQHDGPAPAMLSLPRFNLALSKIKVGNSDGVLGDVDGKTFGLAVERSGRHDVFFDWSLRGSVQADGLAFSLRLPACPLSIIELKLPTGQTLVADRNAGLVSGPMDAERPDLKTWRLQSSGRSQIEIVVRASSESSAPRLVLATSECKQQLVGNVVLADYDFRVEVAQGAATELVFEGDDVLAPYEITVRGAELASWRTERNDAQGQNKGEQATGDMAIRVQLREPLGAQGANLRVRCLAPRPANAAWLSPGLRLRQAVARGETLVLQTTAPLQIERFDPGQFRLVHSAADADGGHTIRLVDLNPEAAAPRRPRLWALGTPADLATREQTRWSIGPGVMTLKAEIACSLRRGSLFQLGARLPAGSWVVDSVSVEPADYLRTWTLAGPMLFVNLQKPLDPRHPLTLSVGLRSDLAAGRFIATAPIPEVRLNELSSRQGVYNIHVDASWNTALVQAPPSLAEPAAPEHPDDATAPRFTFVYRDQALAGALELRPRRPAFTARVRQHVTLADGRGAVSAQLRLQPIFGQPKFVDVFLAGGSADGWRASGNDDPTLTMERAPGPELFGPVQLFGTCSPLGAAANLLYRPRGRTYRVYFAKAAQGPIDVTLLGDIKPAVLPAWSAAVARLATASAWPDLALTAHQLARQDWAPQLWEPPLVTVLGAEHTEGVVRVNPQHHTVLQRRSRGLQEQRDTVSGLTQLFHHHTAYPPVLPLELALTTLSTRGAVLPRNPLESLVVTHYVACDGSAHHHVHIRAAGWTEATLPLAFGAADLTVLGAKIDGRWIELIQQEQEHEALHVRLPMPRDGAVHRLELLLASPPPATWWAPIGSIGQVEPTLPGPVSERRHRWRLAPGLAPLRREATYSLEPDRGTPTDALRRLWSAADSWIAGWTASLGEPWQEPQRRALDRAAADMQPVLSSATFGDAVERLALEAVKIPRPGGGGTALILDRQALAALGLRRGAALSPAVTPAGATGGANGGATGGANGGATGGANGGASRGANGGLWDRLGLVAAPTSQGLLLSCQACIEPQRRGAAAFHAALAAAAEAGQDQSRRYCRSDLWLSSPDEDPASWQWLPMLGASEADGWSEWLPLPANADRAALLVVRAAPLRWAGVALGGLLFIVLQRLRPRWRPAMAMRFLILSAVALGFALFAMPASLGDLAIWPLLAVAAHLTAEWIRCGRALAGSRARSIAPLVAFIIALGGVWRMTGAVVAQVENNDWLTVFYVNADGPRPVALVRPELMKRLEALERRSALAHESAVIVAAAYTGRPQEMTASGGPVRIDVQLDVHSFSERSTLHLPLTAVELLEGTFVDGAPAFPAAGAGKPGFVIPLVGRGFHRVTLAVLARPQLQGDHQEIRCGIPAVALNRLVWQAPAEQPGLQLAKGAGEESRTLLDGGKIREIRAQLGRQNVLHVRWLAAAAPSAVSHEVREAYWWDLDAGAASFTGQLRFTPSKTNLGHVEIALPDRLVVRSVELAATGTSASPRLAKWQIVDNEPARRLRVDFAAPASGSFILRFQAAPRLSFDGGQLSLRLPTPLDAKSVEGVLAYRLPGADAADKTSELNVTALAPEVFAKVWAQHGGTATTAPTRAYSFRRAALGGGLVLALRPLAPRADCEAVWRLTPAGAEATAEITWTASEPLNLLEVQVPAGLKLTGVRGPQLLHWSVHGQRLQAWLTEAGTQARLELSGWLAKPLVKQRFVLPVWTLPNVEATVSTIRTTVPTGWIIEPERLSNLQPLGTDSPPSYQSKAQKYAGAFRVRPPGPAAEFDAFTRLEPRGGALAVLSTVAARASSGRLPAFSIRLRDWTAPVHLEASSAPLEQSHRREGNDQIWRLRFAPAGGRSVRIQLHSYLDASAPIAVPRLEVQGGTLREHLVGWPKEGLRVSGIQGLVEAPATLTARFADAELLRGQGGTVQRTEPGRPWRVLAQTSSASDAPAVRVLYAEQQAALTDGLRWLHRAKYLIQLKDARAFGIALPRRAELVNVTVDGRRVEPFRVAQQPPREQPPREQPLPEQRPSVQRLTVPLPERATLATVELAWQYPEAAEGWLRPDLAAPGLPQGGVAVHGVMLVPAGVGVRSLPPGWLVGDVHAAVGRFRAIAAADKDTAAPAGLAQHAPLARGLRRRLDFLLDIDPHLQAALPALRAELTVAGENPDEALPDAAPGTPLALGLPIDSAGLPLSWRVAAGETIAPVVLEEDAAGPDLGDWVRELLTLALVSMFLLSWLPGGIAWLTRLWPEAIAGLVLVGGVAWGPSVIGGALLAFAVLARVLSLIGLIRAWRVRSAPIAAATDSR